MNWRNTILGALVLLAGSLNAAGQDPEVPSVEIGSIPPQAVWHGNSARLRVSGAGLPVSVSAISPLPAGAIAFDAATGTFQYTPDSQDKAPFDVTFTARGRDGAATQTVTITPLPHLPPEQRVLGLEPLGEVPDPSSPDYLTRHETAGEAQEWFNHQQRTTRVVTISGKAIVFEPGHPSGLYSYSDNADLRELIIHAETVVVRAPLRFPQTNVTIHARELRFEGDGYIDTTPLGLTARPPQFGAGVDGGAGGNVAVFLESFVSDPCREVRFVLGGGAGQPAGLGQDGANGNDMAAMNDTVGNVPKQGDRRLCDYGVRYPPDRRDCSRVVGFMWHDNDVGYPIDLFGPRTGWPGDGQDARQAGRPGNGGRGGWLTSNVLDLLGKHVSSPGGPAGESAPNPQGGRAGQPSPAIRWWYNATSGEGDAPVHVSTAGRSHSAPLGAPGASGGTAATYNPFSWITPFSMRMIVAHARDAYLYRHVEVSRTVLADYEQSLSLYAGAPEWTEVPETWQVELLQLRSEIRGLLAQIARHLDYFGNPPDWVPMLSLEVNWGVFSQEIDRVIDVLYLSYWIQHANADVLSKVAALGKARAALKTEIKDLGLEHSRLVEAIPSWSREVAEVVSETDRVQVELQAQEQQLIDRAESNVSERHKVPGWKKVARTLGAIAKTVPVWQPALAAIGTGLDFVAQTDASTPWEALAEAKDAAKAFKPDEYRTRAANWQDTVGRIDLDRLEDRLGSFGAIKALIGDLETAADPIFQGVKLVQSALRETEVPRGEIEAELARLKASSPEFGRLTVRVEELLANKEALIARVNGAIQDAERMMTAIAHDLIAIDGMNRDVSHGEALIDARAMAYLREMERRARDRLLRYHYYMARAYEYRLLRLYPGELRLQKLVDSFQRLVTAGEPDVLSPEQYRALKAIYEEQLATIAETIFSEYRSKAPGLSAPVPFRLLPDEVARLNAGETIVLNPHELGLVPRDMENVRIANVRVKSVQVSNPGGVPGRFANLWLYIDQSGVSMVEADGEVFRFRHHTDGPRLRWGAIYDAANDTLNPIVPSIADGSLLSALLDRTEVGSSSDIVMMYSRPGARSEISVSRKVQPDGNADLRIESIWLEIAFDFMRRDPNKVILDVRCAVPELAPYVVVDTEDEHGRQDGRGTFQRSYAAGTRVTLTAAGSFGSWLFDAWVLADGSRIDWPEIQVSLSADAVVSAVYLLPPGEGEARFIRGDGDADGRITVTDAIVSLNWLFRGGSGIACRAAADANGDSVVNLTDAIYLLGFLYLGGPAPAGPFPGCGPFASGEDEALTCATVPAACSQ